MIYYDDDCVMTHPIIHGAYLTVVGNKNEYGTPRVINYLVNRRPDWGDCYNAAYTRMRIDSHLDYQLINFCYTPFEYVERTPSHVLTVWYENIREIRENSDKFNGVMSRTLMYFYSNYMLPLYVPYRLDGVITEETWHNIMLPMLIDLYGCDDTRNAVIMPAMIDLVDPRRIDIDNVW